MGRFRVLIAGGGVAALEAALALQHVAEDRVSVALIAPEPRFWYRPLAVVESFGLGRLHGIDLAQLADDDRAPPAPAHRAPHRDGRGGRRRRGRRLAAPHGRAGRGPSARRGRLHLDRRERPRRGLDDVFAAGDSTSFPIKQGGLAAQQADAAAESIAAAAGTPIEPEPFRPVLRALLLTGEAPTFLRAELGGGTGDTSVATGELLWWPPGKIVGRYLAPFLAERAGAILAPPEGAEALPVEVEVATSAKLSP